MLNLIEPFGKCGKQHSDQFVITEDKEIPDKPNKARWAIQYWKTRTLYTNQQQELLIPKFNSLTAKRGDKNIYLFPHSTSQL